MATPISTSFVEVGLPATFLAELQTLLTALENATGRKGGGQIDRRLGTARLKVISSQELSAARDLDACVRNHYREQPDMLAAWSTARHIERAPSRNEDEVPPEGGGTLAVSDTNGTQGGALTA